MLSRYSQSIIKSKSYWSDIQNVRVHIDKNGDSKGSYVLMGLAPSPETSCSDAAAESGSTAYQVIGTFDYSDDSRASLIENAEHPMVWPNGRAPSFQPECGFDGELCPDETERKEALIQLMVFSLCVLALFVAVGVAFAWR